MTQIAPDRLILQKEFKSSSSDNIYITSIYNNCISCNCPAGGKKVLCKHMISLVNECADKLNQERSDLAEKVVQILEFKKMGAEKELVKALCSEIIFVDKKIAENAHDNAKNMKKSSIREFEGIIKLIEDNFTRGQKEAMLQILYSIKPHLFKTIMYLNRRLECKKHTTIWDPTTNEIFDIEDDYIAGGAIVDKLLNKYGTNNEQ